MQSALAQKEHFRKKYEESQKELGKPKPTTPEDTLTGNPMEVVHLAKALGDYTEDEVEFITRNAPEKSIQGIIDASKDDWVKTAILARREKVDKEKSIPLPSTKQSLSKKPIDKITPADISLMSKEEKTDYFIKVGMMKKPR